MDIWYLWSFFKERSTLFCQVDKLPIDQLSSLVFQALLVWVILIQGCPKQDIKDVTVNTEAWSFWSLYWMSHSTGLCSTKSLYYAWSEFFVTSEYFLVYHLQAVVLSPVIIFCPISQNLILNSYWDKDPTRLQADVWSSFSKYYPFH